MNRYWDLSEKERAALTSEQVESMLAVELMEKGVVRVEPPVMLPVDFKKPPSTRMYRIKHDRCYGESGVAYPTVEDAERAMMNAIAVASEYVAGENAYYIHPTAELSVTAIDIASRADIAACKSSNEKANENKKTNDAANREYDIAVRAVTDATEGVWSDWHVCCAKQSRYQRIVDTFAEYKTLCGSDILAATFLGKVFSPEEISAANKWFGFLRIIEVAEAEVCDAVPA